jgi:hypothetical protein
MSDSHCVRLRVPLSGAAPLATRPYTFLRSFSSNLSSCAIFRMPGEPTRQASDAVALSPSFA